MRTLALKPSFNLSDVASASAALANLGGASVAYVDQSIAAIELLPGPQGLQVQLDPRVQLDHRGPLERQELKGLQVQQELKGLQAQTR